MSIDYDADPAASDDDVDAAIADAVLLHETCGWNRGTLWDHNSDAIGEWIWSPDQ